VPLPQLPPPQFFPQTVLTSFTQSWSQLVVQQYGSTWHICDSQVPQLGSSASPSTQVLWLHEPHAPQSAEQLWHDSELSHVPLPHDDGHVWPQTLATSLTQSPSQNESQQNEST
jgi:hypothetical protein